MAPSPWRDHVTTRAREHCRGRTLTAGGKACCKSERTKSSAWILTLLQTPPLQSCHLIMLTPLASPWDTPPHHPPYPLPRREQQQSRWFWLSHTCTLPASSQHLLTKPHHRLPRDSLLD